MATVTIVTKWEAITNIFILAQKIKTINDRALLFSVLNFMMGESFIW